jgi:hypothetical protein
MLISGSKIQGNHLLERRQQQHIHSSLTNR